MRWFFSGLCVLSCFLLVGCDGDYQGGASDPGVDVKGTPDMDPRTDHDIDVKTPDVDVEVKRQPGRLPDVDVDVLQKPDPDKKANER